MFKIPFLGEAETVIKLGIKSLVGDMGLSTSDSIWVLLSFFFNMCLEVEKRRGDGNFKHGWKLIKELLFFFYMCVVLCWLQAVKIYLGFVK